MQLLTSAASREGCVGKEGGGRRRRGRKEESETGRKKEGGMVAGCSQHITPLPAMKISVMLRIPWT